MATKLKLPSAFTDTSLPKFRIDPVLPDSGALLLIDPTHPAGPLAAGVPADGATVPNIAWQQAASLLGSGDATTLAASFGLKGGINNGTKGKVERTTKGGLHVIESRTTPLVAGDGAFINAPLGVRNYIATGGAGLGHTFYISVWARVTRGKTGAFGTFETMIEFGNGNFNFSLGALKLFGSAAGTAANGGWQGPNTAPVNFKGGTNPAGSTGPIDADAVYPAASGSPASGMFGAIWGAPSGVTSYNTQGSSITAAGSDRPSWLLYRLYLEDLTVSGRSYATVSALDTALYAKDVATAGGRYNGDTFTDPATLP